MCGVCSEADLLELCFVSVCNSNLFFIARLSSCLDQMREVLAESVPDQAMEQAVLASKFDVQKALDLVLSQDSKQNVKTKDEDAVIVRKMTKGMLLFNCLDSRCFICIYIVNFGFTGCEDDYCCVSNLLEILKMSTAISLF